jgi:hypothetical protein
MEDYGTAAIRHYKNADVLRKAGDLDNAGHLIGFAAECAVKHRINSLRPNSGNPHGHFPDITEIAKKHLGERSAYTSMFQILKGTVLNGWHVNRRYYKTGHTTPQEIEAWFSDTRRLFATASLKAL